MTARNPALGVATVKELHQQGINNVEFLQLDIDNKQSVIDAAEMLHKKYNGIDILINNAGNKIVYCNITILAIATYSSTLTEQIATGTINTNYFSTLFTLEKFLPLIKNGGRVVNLASPISYMINYGPHVENLLFSGSLTIVSRSYHELSDIKGQLNGLMNQFVQDVKIGQLEQHGWPKSVCIIVYGQSDILRAMLSPRQQCYY